MAQVISVEMTSHAEEVKAEAKAKIAAWLEAIGEDAAQTAANFAPVDTGRLKNSISSAVDTEEQVAYIGTNVEYAPYQEFGTSNGVEGKHFIQFGATAHQSEYKAMLEQALRE